MTTTTRNIEVDGEVSSVTCVQISKSRWRAYGDSFNRNIDVTAPSASMAFERWKSTAQMYNG